LDSTDLHIVLATTHVFDKSLLHTVCRDNINPIEKAERTSLIVASTIFEQSPASLVKASQLPRLKQFNAPLFIEEAKHDDENESKK